MTSEKLKPTPGPWDFGADRCPDNATALAICKENIDAHTKPSSGHFFVVFTPDGRRTAMVGHGPDGAANAQFIAEAGTVHHECGLSPRELLTLIQAIVTASESDGASGGEIFFAEAVSSPISTARAALAKHKEV